MFFKMLIIPLLSLFSFETAVDRPHKNCYWVKQDRFLAGEYPGDENPPVARKRLKAYLDAGINYFIDLTEKRDSITSYEPMLFEEAKKRRMSVNYVRMSIPDMSIPTPEHMKNILATIDAALAEGHNVYVHCWGGIGRTGTVISCYLKKHGMTSEQALAQLQDWWNTVAKSIYVPRSPQTEEQFLFIQNFNA